MKKIILLTAVSLVLFSCSENDFKVPVWIEALSNYVIAMEDASSSEDFFSATQAYVHTLEEIHEDLQALFQEHPDFFTTNNVPEAISKEQRDELIQLFLKSAELHEHNFKPEYLLKPELSELVQRLQQIMESIR